MTFPWTSFLAAFVLSTILASNLRHKLEYSSALIAYDTVGNLDGADPTMQGFTCNAFDRYILPETVAEILSFMDDSLDDIVNFSQVSSLSGLYTIQYYLWKSMESPEIVSDIIKKELIDWKLVTAHSVHSLALAHRSILIWAAESGQAEVVKYLLKNSPKKGMELDYAFAVASVNKNFHISDIILESGVNLRFQEDVIFRMALRKGDISVVTYLLDLGIFNNYDKNRAFKSAVYNRHLDLANYLKSRYAEFIDFGSALMQAADLGYLEMVELVIDDARHGYGHQALLSASLSGYADIVEFLLERGFNIPRKFIPLDIMATHGYDSCIKVFFDRGIITIDDIEGLLFKAAQSNDAGTVKLLVDYGAILTQESLLHALKRGNLEIIKILIDAGIRIPSKFEWRQAIIADDRIIDLLLQKGVVDPRLIRMSNDELLVSAARRGHIRCVRKLVNEEKANINFGCGAALMEASEHGHLQVVKFLVKKGLNVRVRGNYASSLAVLSGNLELLEYLVHHGAILQNRIHTMIRDSTRLGYASIFKYLTAHPAFTFTPLTLKDCLFTAIQIGNLEIIKTIFEIGNIETLCKSGLRIDAPLRIAIDNNHLHVVRYLLQHKCYIDSEIQFALIWASGNGYLAAIIDSLE